MTRGLSALESVSASRTVRTGRFYCSLPLLATNATDIATDHLEVSSCTLISYNIASMHCDVVCTVNAREHLCLGLIMNECDWLYQTLMLCYSHKSFLVTVASYNMHITT